MLTITARNIGGTNMSATYEVNVLINSRLIWEGVINGHDRGDGWQDLLQMIAKEGAKYA